MKKITRKNYSKDRLYPSVREALRSALQTQDVVSTIVVLMHMERLTKDKYEDWRFGRISCLEEVLIGNLSKMNRILRILDLCAQDFGLSPSETAYRKWGKRGKGISLRFSRSGDPNVEKAYSRCYIRKKPKQAHDTDVGDREEGVATS